MKKLAGIFFVSLVGMLISACDGSWSTISITIEDFRFMPDLIRVNASVPLSIAIYNAGREVHEFDSQLLTYSVKSVDSLQSGSGISVQPGKTLHLIVAPPPGTYVFFCRRKGHANMAGTVIVSPDGE